MSFFNNTTHNNSSEPMSDLDKQDLYLWPVVWSVVYMGRQHGQINQGPNKQVKLIAAGEDFIQFTTKWLFSGGWRWKKIYAPQSCKRFPSLPLHWSKSQFHFNENLTHTYDGTQLDSDWVPNKSRNQKIKIVFLTNWIFLIWFPMLFLLLSSSLSFRASPLVILRHSLLSSCLLPCLCKHKY